MPNNGTLIKISYLVFFHKTEKTYNLHIKKDVIKWNRFSFMIYIFLSSLGLDEMGLGIGSGHGS